jgi:hypothetical protein
MEPFEILIDVNGSAHALLSVPFPGELKYNIFNGLDYLCTVWPEVIDEQVNWKTNEDVQLELLLMIGNGIEKALNDKLAENE